MKARGLSWFGHVHRTAIDKMVNKLHECKPTSTGLAGRPNIRQENDKQEDLRVIKINNWTKCSQNKVK
jgi:hypothetical protein